jgi:hypothetical protein
MVRCGRIRGILVLLLASVGAAGAQTTIVIDVAPGNTPTEIESGRGGLLPVAMLSTAAFDATTLDQTTIRFGPTGTEAGPARTVTEDVDRDGRQDLMSLFRVADLELPCGGVALLLTAETASGGAVAGSERVTVIGCAPG